jgi:DNA-directed RNA polymerase subunit RPC12/RpoP
MGQVVNQSFACAACGKRFKWKPDLAGKRVKCPCGAGVEVPRRDVEEEAPAASGLDGFDDLFGAHAVDAPPLPTAPPLDEAQPAQTATSKPKPAVRRPQQTAPPAPQPSEAQLIAERLGIALPTRKRLDMSEEVQAGRAEMEKLASGSLIRDIVLPIPIILVGIMLSYAQARQYSEHPAATAAAAWGVVATRVALSVGLILLAMWLLTSFMDVNFLGSFGKCVLRLCAIAIGPAAVYDTLVFTVGGDLAGPFAGVAASVALWGVLYWGLMRVDLKDATVCVMVTFILVTFANYAAWRAEGMIRGSDI